VRWLCVASQSWSAALSAFELRGYSGPRTEKERAVTAFLLSDDAEWITGQVWYIGGGSHLRQ